MWPYKGEELVFQENFCCLNPFVARTAIWQFGLITNHGSNISSSKTFIVCFINQCMYPKNLRAPWDRLLELAVPWRTVAQVLRNCTLKNLLEKSCCTFFGVKLLFVIVKKENTS